ncbi:MAG: 2-hydroxyacyl-CoA dehydratase [Deltaproteobacteria bacterium]|nr:2-hydroxyacyl-CoA dehydratase [Deltaproteobacteria bacterium]
MELISSQAPGLENDHVIRWKQSGRSIVGYTCVATPTEIIEAGGLLPYRIRALGNGNTEIADAHLSRFNCSFCRSCLQLGLDGSYDFLDGIIETNGCDHLRGMIENWVYQRRPRFFHYLKVPHLGDSASIEYFVEEIKIYKKAIEEFVGRSISDQQIWEQIGRQDRISDKIRTIYRIREGEKPSITGAETLALFLLATAMPANDAENTLQRAIDDCKDRALDGYKARLLLGGSATDEVDFVAMIERLGGLVVTDTLCYGARAFRPRLLEGKRTDPYLTLANGYLENLLCPRMIDGFRSRLSFLLDAIERAAVDGVVLVHNKFCDLHGIDNVQLRLALERESIPVLQIEKEYGARADIGRLKTRIQAFLERIG